MRACVCEWDQCSVKSWLQWQERQKRIESTKWRLIFSLNRHLLYNCSLSFCLFLSKLCRVTAQRLLTQSKAVTKLQLLKENYKLSGLWSARRKTHTHRDTLTFKLVHMEAKSPKKRQQIKACRPVTRRLYIVSSVFSVLFAGCVQFLNISYQSNKTAI